MKYSSFKVVFYSAIWGLALTMMFCACGEKSTNVIEVAESTGLTVVAKGDTLPECSVEKNGKMIYVEDSSAVYYCNGTKWSTLNGIDGSKALDGENGLDGTGCTAKTVDDGLEVSCGGVVVGTVKNGDNAKNCSVNTNADGESYTIHCDGSDDVVVKNGEPETSCVVDDFIDDVTKKTGYKIFCGGVEKGVIMTNDDVDPNKNCKTEEQDDGTVLVTCGEGVQTTKMTLYKPICINQSFDPTKEFCYKDKVYALCNGKIYNPENKFCLDEALVKVTKGTMNDSRGDGQTYKILTFDVPGKNYNETWMAENLNYVLDDGTRSWCYGQTPNASKEDYAENCKTYGRLYTWDAAMSACPNGWHLPNNGEWYAFWAAIGGYGNAGKLLKSTSGWDANGNGTDLFGFSVLPAGQYTNNFVEQGGYAYFWSSTQYDRNYADKFYFRYDINNVYRDANHTFKSARFSVRCLKDHGSDDE